jgi:hypothetical protein
MFSLIPWDVLEYPGGYAYSRLKTTAIEHDVKIVILAMYVFYRKSTRRPSCWSWNVTTDGQSVSQLVRLGVDPAGDLRPDINSIWIAALALWLSDERSGLSLVNHCQ